MHSFWIHRYSVHSGGDSLKKTHVLVAEDEPAIARYIKYTLEDENYVPHLAADGMEALAIVENTPLDLALLDIMMPKLSGIEVCRKMREWSQIPVIMLSACSADEDKVKCLDLGADDYMTKPFSITELTARIRSVLRRTRKPDNTPVSNYQCDGLEMLFSERKVKHNSAEIPLTSTEYGLLEELAKNAGKVVSYQHLLNTIWGDEYRDEIHYLHVFIGRLRRKLKSNPGILPYIETVSGYGYCLRN